MRLSSILHKYIRKGRDGASPSGKYKDVTLTDKQLLELWTKATEIEADLYNYHTAVKKLADKKFRTLL